MVLNFWPSREWFDYKIWHCVLMRNMSRMILRFWSWKGKTLIITWSGKVNDLQICWCRKLLRNKKKKLKKKKTIKTWNTVYHVEKVKDRQICWRREYINSFVNLYIHSLLINDEKFDHDVKCFKRWTTGKFADAGNLLHIKPALAFHRPVGKYRLSLRIRTNV